MVGFLSAEPKEKYYAQMFNAWLICSLAETRGKIYLLLAEKK